jgi:hypothetical protein
MERGGIDPNGLYEAHSGGFAVLVALYDGGAMNGQVIRPWNIDGRVLSLVIPKGMMTSLQREVLDAARIRAQAFDVDLIITKF